jgi:hypothetical protein
MLMLSEGIVLLVVRELEAKEERQQTHKLGLSRKTFYLRSLDPLSSPYLFNYLKNSHLYLDYYNYQFNPHLIHFFPTIST